MLQFVPIENSLEDNAPGYDDDKAPFIHAGPTCWKCDGRGFTLSKKQSVICKVCKGDKRLPVKVQAQHAPKRAGERTAQTLPAGWTPRGPVSAFSQTAIEDLPAHLQPQEGEQLCVFVGSWRILQRYGGHRWTTDDLVTAWVAGRTARSDPSNHKVHRTLDLGCGNGSVLMMVAWQYPNAQCMGVEARSEAVALARRSIEYNCGAPEPGEKARINVVNCDFRTLIDEHGQSITSCTGLSAVAVPPCDSELSETDLPPGRNTILRQKFDLVTGTPPYFRVDFQTAKPDVPSSDHATSNTANEGEVVSRTVIGALIRQGGMPTCKESAPARCEFRGGIEAYCAAAKAVLAEDGHFVVCENWANHDRALAAAPAAGLVVTSVLRVVGKEGKPPLFCVYTMKHASPELGGIKVIYEPELVVRDANGAWTLQYTEVLHDMSYPVASLHPSGAY